MPAKIGTVRPVLDLGLHELRHIPRIVRAVTGPRGLMAMAQPPSDRALALTAAALGEVLGAVLRRPVPRKSGSVSVELWIEPALIVLAVRYAGPPLPDYMVVNWDRGEPPAMIAPPGDSGWGWLTVREAVDSVVQLPARGGSVLLLEKRL